MKSINNAEANVLERMMYMLEEGSVTHLMQNDKRFASYIGGLYKSIDAQWDDLRRGTTT